MQKTEAHQHGFCIQGIHRAVFAVTEEVVGVLTHLPNKELDHMFVQYLSLLVGRA